MTEEHGLPIWGWEAQSLRGTFKTFQSSSQSINEEKNIFIMFPAYINASCPESSILNTTESSELKNAVLFTRGP